MKTTFHLITLISAVFLFSAFTTATPAVGPWVKLGAKKVNYKLDRDVIRVGPNDGTFTKLKVLVTGGSLNMHKMIVEYGNGTKDVIPLKHTFSRKSSSRVIDLQGGNRVIKDITFWYDSKDLSRNRATVHVFGRK